MAHSTHNYSSLYILIVITSLLTSCNVTKYLPEDEQLYTGAELNINKDSSTNANPEHLQQEIEKQLKPKPNSKLLGLYPRLWFYLSTKEPKKDKGIRHFLKYKLGQQPVLMKDVDVRFNTELVKNYAENKGYFKAKSSWDTITKNKKTSVIYTLQPNDRWYIDNVIYENDSTLISSYIQQSSNKSLINEQQPFNLARIKQERSRIDSYLKENGFYYFHEDNILAQADSTVSEHGVDLHFKLKEQTPELAKQQFNIDKVIVYPNYSFSGLENQRNPVPTNVDSLEIFEDIYVIDPKNNYKPELFIRALNFRSGDIYNRKNHNSTLNRLINLGVFKFVKNQFYISDSTKNQFDAYYLLTPQPLQALQAEVKASTNSANYVGSELNVNWRHRNLFHGAETFKLETYGAFNLQVGGVSDKEARNIFRVGARTSLELPRIVAPFKFNESGDYMPTTKFKLGYEHQERTNLYSLHNANGSAGYVWKQNALVEHQLQIVDLSLVSPSYVTDDYKVQIDGNPYLQRIVEDQLIFGPSYQYNFTNAMLPKKHTFYYNGLVDLSGNILGLVTGANVKEGKQKEVFGVPFSQYVKTEQDIRYYLKMSNKHALATRILAGIAYPYGNSEYIPFSKQFFAGGSSNNRGFRARTLGPGSYDPRPLETTFIFDQAGDIALQTSIEYRPKLHKYLEGAVFIDAGNVWLVNKNEDFVGGQFSKDFLKELAISTGLGLRLDLDVLLIRADVGTPIHKPYLQQGNRWIFNDINPFNKDWRKDNLILNIAIGYPF